MNKKQQLSLSLRPKNFGELVGQEAVVSSIQKHIQEGRLATSWLFDGPPGTGKTTIARIIALSLQCTHQTFGWPCVECRRNKNNFNIKEEKAAKLTVGSNQSEALEGFFADSHYLPSEGSKVRSFILDEPQTLSGKGQDFLLDVLEKEVSSTIVFLCTSRPQDLSKAMRRRCFTHHMRPLNEDDVEKYVKWVLTKTESQLDASKLSNALLEAEIYSPGIIVQACELYLSGRTPRDSCKVDLDAGYAHKVITRAIKRGDWETVRLELSKAKPEDARNIQMGVAGFLRSILLDSDMGSEAVALSKAIKLVSGNYPDRVMLSVLSAMAYDLCALFRR